MVEKVYKGTQIYVTNKFIWWEPDTSQNFSNYDTKLFEETIFPDSTNRNKQINISLTSKGNSLCYGQFSETFPISSNSRTSNLYNFELNEKNISFDRDRKLILDSIKKK